MKFKCEVDHPENGRGIIIYASKGNFEEQDTFHVGFYFNENNDLKTLSSTLECALNSLFGYIDKKTARENNGQTKPEVGQ